MTIREYLNTQADKDSLRVFLDGESITTEELLDQPFQAVYFTRVNRLVHPDKSANAWFESSR